jgi:hypothetical protein
MNIKHRISNIEYRTDEYRMMKFRGRGAWGTVAKSKVGLEEGIGYSAAKGKRVFTNSPASTQNYLEICMQ